jgi:hypothetical protein
LFHNSITVEELKSYDELEQKEELKDIEKVKQRFQLLSVLSKLHNIIVDTYSSANRTQEFLALCLRIIPLNNCTKWNSWYLCLFVATKYKGAIDQYTKDH